MSPSLKAFEILGVKIYETTLEKTVDFIESKIRSGDKSYVVLTGAHGIIEMQSDDLLKTISNNAGLVTPDGMPEVWIGKLKGYKDIEKVYAPELMYSIFGVSVERGYRHFFYGGKEGVAQRLAAVLREEYPGIDIVGMHTPPFRPLTPREKEEVVDEINQSGADIVWCGLGCPKQEKWMYEFRPLLKAPVLIGVGAGFDFLSGQKPLAPFWITRSGFEWLYRLLSDPRHLMKRYAKVIPQFIIFAVLELIGLHRKKLTNK